MRKTLLIASLTAFAVVAAFAAPRNVDVPTTSTTTEEVAVNSNIDNDTVSNSIKPVDEKMQGCGCPKPKKSKR